MIDRDQDRQVLATLAAHGSDLSKPAHTIHYLYFRSKNGADEAGRELQAAGYQNVRVERGAPKSLRERVFGSREFVCIAETRAVPSEANVFAATDRMNALAARLGGYYDGWVASIER
jgi:hypothetical protein